MRPPIQQSKLVETEHQFMLIINPTDKHKAIYCFVVLGVVLAIIDLVPLLFLQDPYHNEALLFEALLIVNIIFTIGVLCFVSFVFLINKEKIEFSIQKDSRVFSLKAYGRVLQESIDNLISFVVFDGKRIVHSPKGYDVTHRYSELCVLVKVQEEETHVKVFESMNRFLVDYFERILKEAIGRIKGRAPASMAAEDLHAQGVQQWESGDKKGALVTFHNVLEMNPYFVQCLIDMGVLLDEMGEPENAIQYFLKAVGIDTHAVDAWFNLGNVYLTQMKWDRAADAFFKVVDIDRTDIDAWKGIFKAYDEKVDIDSAINAYHKAIVYNPENEEFRRDLERLEDIALKRKP